MKKFECLDEGGLSKELDTQRILDTNESLKFYHKIKSNDHIFIYSVGGRSSSNSLQRILNSSYEICIFGEPSSIEYFKEPNSNDRQDVADLLLESIRALDKINKSEWISNQSKNLVNSFKTGEFKSWDGAAIRSLEGVEYLKASFANLFRPIIDVDRIGYKDIGCKSVQNLETLTKIFPNSKIVFLFRNPLNHWPSISSGYGLKEDQGWYYRNDIKKYLAEYNRLSSIYLQFNNLYQNSIFIENTCLFFKRNVDQLLNKLNINYYDNLLINDNLFSCKHLQKQSAETSFDLITNSLAYNKYEKMRELSQGDFIDKKNEI